MNKSLQSNNQLLKPQPSMKIETHPQQNQESDIQVPQTDQFIFQKLNKHQIEQSIIKIPHVSNLGPKTKFIQQKLAEGNTVKSFQMYKQFVPKKLLVNDKFQTYSLFKAFSFQIFNLYSLSDLGKYELTKIKDKVYKVNSFQSYIIQLKCSTIKQHGGTEISNDQIKRIFLEYLIKLFEQQSSIKIIQQYYVLSDILTMIVNELTLRNIGTKEGKNFQQATKTLNVEQIYRIYAKVFKLKYFRFQNLHTFTYQSKKLIIQKQQQMFKSWIKQ